MKPSVGIVGIIYEFETAFTREVEKSGADNSGFKKEKVLYIDHNYHVLFDQLGCHLSVISPAGDAEIVSRFDMLVLPGGPDVNPELYGQKPHPLTSFDSVRDQFEQNAIAQAMQKEIPILAICRGCQMVNVALGGSLRQHLPDWSNEVSHRPPGGPKADAHPVLTEGWLKRLIGKEAAVNSWHHQGIDRLAPGLEPLAWTEDGLVEAYQSAKDLPPIFAVQWHPELLHDQASYSMLSHFLETTILTKKK